MGAGFLGSREDIRRMAENVKHPKPETVKTFGELINWIAERDLAPATKDESNIDKSEE